MRANTPEEKKVIVDRFYELWLRHPQLRFGQLIKNVHKTDFYYMEDEPFIEQMERFYQYQEDRKVLFQNERVVQSD